MINKFYELWAGFLVAVNRHIDDEQGMSTIEYCLGCVAAAALGGVLYTIVTSDAVENTLRDIFHKALQTNSGG